MFDLEAFDALCVRALDRLAGRDYDALEAWSDGETLPGFAVGAVPTVEMVGGEGDRG